MSNSCHVRLIDAPDEAGRTTATLFSSLATRLVTLHYTSGIGVVGSTLVGLAQIGREISQTAEGAKLRSAIEKSAACKNGITLWKALRLPEWTNGMPASPVLDHVRNDLALLLCDDLDKAIANVPVPQETSVKSSEEAPVDLNFVDTMMGLWVYSREVVRSIEVLADGINFDEIIKEGGVGEGGILR